MQPSEGNRKTVLMIITIAMCLGATLFALVVMGLMIGNGNVAVNLTEVITIVSIAFAVMNSVLAFVIPSILQKSLLKSNEPEGVLQTTTIIKFALLEGAAMFCLVAALVENNLLPWIVGVALIGLMASQVVSPSRYDQQLAKLTDMASK
ncbi:MAG: hypothetical protein R3C03_08500 [Pirellulaceae bacterium]